MAKAKKKTNKKSAPKKKKAQKKAAKKVKQSSRKKTSKGSKKRKKEALRKKVKKPKKIKKSSIKKPKKRKIKKIKQKKAERQKTQKKKTYSKKKKAKKKTKYKAPKERKRGKKTTDPLEELFESSTKLQLMKLFFRNPERVFSFRDVIKTIKTEKKATKKYLKKLEKTGLIKSKRISSRKQMFFLNPDFEFFKELKDLILKSSPVSKEKMLKQIKRLGRIKLVLLSGLFVGSNTAKADLLIVGDNLNQRKVSNFIKKIEAEAGTEINCAAMSTEEFNYRYDMYDRFVRDLLEGKRELLINNLGL